MVAMAGNGAARNGAAQEREGEGTVRISIVNQYIKDFSFENPGAPHSFGSFDPPPDMAVEMNVAISRLEEAFFEVVLRLQVRVVRGEQTFFLAELAYGGVVKVPPLPEAVRARVLGAEAPKLMFPFARAIIANAVRDGGYPQLLFDPVDFDEFYKRNAGGAARAAAPADAGAGT